MPRVTQKGQVTIPQEIRSVLKIRKGDEVVFELKKGKVWIERRHPSIQNIRKYVGFLGRLKGRDADEIIKDLRGEPDDPGR
jgi:AbrB family looped-hinge helix DNA binding protein